MRVVVVRGVIVNIDHAKQVHVTSASELLRRELTAACTTPNGRLVVSVPPQEGLKTSLVRELCVSLLKKNPNHHVMYITYSEAVAAMQGCYVRSMFRTPSHHTSDDWRITGHLGGMMAEGVWSDLLGGFHSVVVVDDPIRWYPTAAREQQKERELLHDWWSTFIATRLAPGASVVAVQSRMHRDDLAGRLIAQGWPSLNIPALADGELQTPSSVP